jgi:hypothetical protein
MQDFATGWIVLTHGCESTTQQSLRAGGFGRARTVIWNRMEGRLHSPVPEWVSGMKGFTRMRRSPPPWQPVAVHKLALQK